MLRMKLCPPNSHVEAPAPNMTISGDRVHGKAVRQNEVVKMGPDPAGKGSFFPPGEDTVRRRSSASQAESSAETVLAGSSLGQPPEW